MSTPSQVPRSQITSTSWAVALLTTAKLPVTQNNVDNILRWMQLEGGSSGGTPGVSGSMETWLHMNDPLNASLHESGQFSYPSVEAGLTNTAAMLHQSNMSPIYNALKQNAPLSQFSSALAASPWDGSHYSSQIAQYGSNFLSAFPELAAFATATGLNPTGTGLGGRAPSGQGSQPSTSLTATQFNAGVKNNALQIGTALAKGAKVLAQTPQSSLGAVASEMGSIGKDLSGVNTVVTDLTKPGMWVRIGEGLAGIALLVGGLVLFVASSDDGKKAISTGAEVAAVA
jgi:hypothetical protein